MAWTGELGDFSEFYKPGGQERTPPKPTTQDHIQMMRDRGEGGPPIS